MTETRSLDSYFRNNAKYHSKIMREQGRLRTVWHQMTFLLNLPHYDLMY